VGTRRIKPTLVADPGTEQVAITMNNFDGYPNQVLVNPNDQLLEHYSLPPGSLLGVAILTHAGALFLKFAAIVD
jgi:hypothetical protein